MSYDEDTYIRPHDRRFNPTEWERQIAQAPWIDCDPVAAYDVEESDVYKWDVGTDKNGYPTS